MSLFTILATSKVAAGVLAAGAVAAGGTGVAAFNGALPTGIQQSAHDLVGAPAPVAEKAAEAADAAETAKTKATDAVETAQATATEAAEAGQAKPPTPCPMPKQRWKTPPPRRLLASAPHSSMAA